MSVPAANMPPGDKRVTGANVPAEPDADWTCYRVGVSPTEQADRLRATEVEMAAVVAELRKMS